MYDIETYSCTDCGIDTPNGVTQCEACYAEAKAAAPVLDLSHLSDDEYDEAWYNAMSCYSMPGW
jgi:predicted ATP-dependent serine protease